MEFVIKIVFYIFCFIFIFGIPSYMACSLKDYKGAALVCIFSVIFLATINSDKIRIFKMWGIEAELKETIHEANATIDQLKEIALTISAPVYDELAMHGSVFSRISFEARYNRKQEIDQALLKIGVKQEKIDDASSLWRSVAEWWHVRKIFDDTDELGELAKNWNDLLRPYYDAEKRVPPEEIEKFLKNNNLMNQVREERLNDYLYFLETGKIKHPERWEAGFEVMRP